MIKGLITILLSVVAAAPALAEKDCFDLAVIATSPKYNILPIIPAPDPDDIIIRRPVRISFLVEDVLIGEYNRNEVQIDTSFHTPYIRDIRHYLMLLKKASNGRFLLIDMEINIVKLSNGEYALPITGPLEDYQIQPEGFISVDYKARMNRLHYVRSEAWWLAPDRISSSDQEELVEKFPWAEMNKGRITAPRGLEVRTLIPMMLPDQCPRHSAH